MARRICIFTGTRADYGLLHWLMKEIHGDADMELQVLVSGTHLCQQFGLTWKDIETDGLPVSARVEMLLASDTPVAVATSMGLGVVRFADTLDRLRPDMLVVLGDRYEALAAVQAAMMLTLPIAHIHGGEATEGVIDDTIRHAITKMAQLHFTSAEPYRQRVIQLGEHPDRVFNVGAPGVENFARLDLPDRAEVARRVGLDLNGTSFLVTYHPATLGAVPPERAVRELLTALDRFPEASVIITKANADAGGRVIDNLVAEYAATRAGRVHVAANLGQSLYLGALKAVSAVIGNSSSGIIEAPVAGTPTVNIGDRQRGRLRAPSVIDCGEEADAIANAIERALSPDIRALAARRETPYGDGRPSIRMKECLKAADPQSLLRKSFYDVSPA